MEALDQIALDLESLRQVVGAGVAGAQRATNAAPTPPPSSCKNRRRLILKRRAFAASLSSILLISFLLFYRNSVLAAGTLALALAPLAETETFGPCYPLRMSLTAELHRIKPVIIITGYHPPSLSMAGSCIQPNYQFT